MSTMELRFGSPEHGWLSVNLRGSSDEVVLDVSDVPGDSLLQLVRVACDIVDKRGDGEVVWFLEPAVSRWRFVREGDLVDIWVLDGARSERLFARENASRVCWTVWRALRRLEADPAWNRPDADLDRVWSHPFPSRDLEYLGKRLKEEGSRDQAG